MATVALVCSWLVVVLHVVFALAETVGWSAMARRFGYDAAATQTTKSLALNQGFYNLGVAAMLAWALITGHGDAALVLLIFVAAMSIVGALSVRWTIFVAQGVPAIAAIAASLL